MDNANQSNDINITTGLKWGAIALGTTIAPTLGLPALGLYGLYKLWKKGEPVRQQKREARHAENLAEQQRLAYEAHLRHVAEQKKQEREAKAQAEARKPPPKTKSQEVQELYAVLTAELAGIEAMPIPEDEKTFLRNQTVDDFMAKRDALLR